MHLAYSTEDIYCGWIARYYDHCHALDPTMAPEAKAESFLTYLAVEKNVAAMTQNQAFAAVLFLQGGAGKASRQCRCPESQKAQV